MSGGLDPLSEVDRIFQAIHAYESEEAKKASARAWQVSFAAVSWWSALGGLLVLYLPIRNESWVIGVSALTLLSALISAGLGVNEALREWQRRRLETLELLQQAASSQKELAEELLAFSRPALLYAADLARSADQRVNSRIGVFLGPNRAGGVLGALFLVLGIFVAGKYLQENKTSVPLLNTPVTAEHVILFGAFLLFFSLTLLFASASLMSLTSFATLLERIAALKKNLADER